VDSSRELNKIMQMEKEKNRNNCLHVEMIKMNLRKVQQMSINQPMKDF
jgi:hypothetical protein